MQAAQIAPTASSSLKTLATSGPPSPRHRLATSSASEHGPANVGPTFTPLLSAANKNTSASFQQHSIRSDASDSSGLVSEGDPGPSLTTSTPNTSSSVNILDPLFQQLTDVTFGNPGLKEKSSMELENDQAQCRPTAYGLFSPDASDGTATHSGPSRTSTPFYAGDTDYESALESDAFSGTNARLRQHSSEEWTREQSQADQRSYDGRSWQSFGQESRREGAQGWVSRLLNGPSFRMLGTSRRSEKLHPYQRLDTLPSTKGLPNHTGHRQAVAWQQGHHGHHFTPSMLKSPLQLMSYLGRSVQTCLLAHHPAKVVLALAFVAGFIASTTLLIIYILNPDKHPKPWRSFCAEQAPFPHTLADSLAPVDVFVGVMTIDANFERREVIRQTYARTQPVDPITGVPMANVQLKFILGRPKPALAHRVALEIEAYNDIVVLDIKENQYRGKSYSFFQWAAENATVPILRPASIPNSVTGGKMQGTARAGNGHFYDVAWKKVDYVVKADDDTFMILHELERHLRVAPRKLTYWGYLIKDWFMGGEAYALSADLVSWIATSPNVAAHSTGKEDTTTARWIRSHPQAQHINYVSERCWIYDHPKAGTPYSHGFLYPNEVQKIIAEERFGLDPETIARRGGERASKWYSTASIWKRRWRPSAPNLSIEEEIESLVEGGGLYAKSGYRNGEPRAEIEWDSRVYSADDERLDPRSRGHGKLTSPARLRGDWHLDSESGLPLYASANESSSSHHASSNKQQLSSREGDESDSASEDEADPPTSSHFLDRLPLVGALGRLRPDRDDGRFHDQEHEGQARRQGLSKNDVRTSSHFRYSSLRHPDRIPYPQEASSYALPGVRDRRMDESVLRGQRYLLPASMGSDDNRVDDTPATAQDQPTGRTQEMRGGTVVVHYVKRNEWFLETALALMGRAALRGPSTTNTLRDGRQWSMYGSPSQVEWYH
ncbi:unnamed protein product [Jaminaea pallidilutea]